MSNSIFTNPASGQTYEVSPEEIVRAEEFMSAWPRTKTDSGFVSTSPFQHWPSVVQLGILQLTRSRNV